MVKGLILGVSVFTLALFVLWQLQTVLGFGDSAALVIAVLTFVSWFSLAILVFVDVDRKRNRMLWVAVTFFTGWLGGVVYSLAVKDGEVTQEMRNKQRSGNFKAAAIFNFVIAGILLLAALLSIAGLSRVTFILAGLAALFFFVGYYLWRK